MRFLAAAVTLFAFTSFALSAAIPPSDSVRRPLSGLPILVLPAAGLTLAGLVAGLPQALPRGFLGNPDHTVNARLLSNEKQEV